MVFCSCMSPGCWQSDWSILASIPSIRSLFAQLQGRSNSSPASANLVIQLVSTTAGGWKCSQVQSGKKLFIYAWAQDLAQPAFACKEYEIWLKKGNTKRLELNFMSTTAKCLLLPGAFTSAVEQILCLQKIPSIQSLVFLGKCSSLRPREGHRQCLC